METSDCTPITKCLACGSIHLKPVLDLGFQPLANEYLKDNSEVQQEFPLVINRCEECVHVQLSHQVNPELMFKNYSYVSGTSGSATSWFQTITELGVKELGRNPKDVLDIGCNDGSLLDTWDEGSYSPTTYGVDPAENLHKISSQRHNVHCGFFTGKEFGDKKFDVITCLNAFAHNPDPLQLLLNIKEVMKDDSVLICTTSQANMILNGEFDTIYHEHVSYFNILSMRKLCARAGLVLYNVERHPVHGTSYVFTIRKTGNAKLDIIREYMLEATNGLYNPAVYDTFAEKAYATADKWAGLIRVFRQAKYPIIGYSAPAKGNTFMNFAKEHPDLIFEDTVQKQGKFTPGMRVPIRAPDFALLENHEGVVWPILAWNVFDDIVNKIKAARPGKKDVFVRYFPTFEVIV